MDLPAADYGRVLNKIQPFRAALPCRSSFHQPATRHSTHGSPVRPCLPNLSDTITFTLKKAAYRAHLQNPSYVNNPIGSAVILIWRPREPLETQIRL